MPSTASTPVRSGGATSALVVALLVMAPGCDDAQPVDTGPPGEAPFQLAARYAVDIRALRIDNACLIEGLAPTATSATATVEQRRRGVVWSQQADGAADAWRLSGHLCDDPDGGPATLRLRGGLTATARIGGESCLANLSLPQAHSIIKPAEDRCDDPDNAVVELRDVGCGVLEARFIAGIKFTGSGCHGQPECRIQMAWRATPSDGGSCGADDMGLDLDEGAGPGQVDAGASADADAAVRLDAEPTEGGRPLDQALAADHRPGQPD